MRKHRPLAATLLGFAMFGGCNEHPLVPVHVTRESEDHIPISVNPNRNVDILFVLDNSGSMAEEQGNLARNFAAFVGVLETESVDANYRIAVTTTDVDTGGLCPQSTPEQGNFVMSSCRSRIEDFTAMSRDGHVDARAEACESACPAEWSDFRTSPTAIDASSERSSRPWMERIDGTTNLPEGLTTAEAFACFGPQGIVGCGLEAPLEAMYLALTRTTANDQDEYGFLRDDALLAIVFVTDEVDCSMRPQTRDVFGNDGLMAFWNDAQAEGTGQNATCWAAGVACDDDANGVRHCEPANVGRDGRPADEDDAVLHPMSRYITLIDHVIERKRQVRPDAAVFVSVISGVPTSYRGGDLSYPHPDGSDFVHEFGTAPGCSGNGLAVPPVRLRAFAESFSEDDEQVVFSVCSESYVEALQSIAHALEARFVPACIQSCPADVDPTTSRYEPNCNVVERMPDGDEVRVAWCTGTPDDPALPEGENVCAIVAIGDDRHPTCVDEDLPAEFKILRREGAPRVPGAAIEASCALSDDPETDCAG